ncbi:MAG: hypothetical protein LDL13_03710 [Calditerrivibrio sp.]|nr:hypothetical protein [Calditerrivibrio sp.]MCA1932664.1 hypothetical protein [Calditerrivibrio sp.]
MKYITVFVFSLFLVSCFSGKSNTNSEYSGAPEWVYGNTPSGKICYVGSSMPHVSGKPYQRALALSRAIEGIARQKNVKVNVEVESLMSGTKEGASTSMNVYSVQTTEGAVVKAKIDKIWVNPENSEIFILMCED